MQPVKASPWWTSVSRRAAPAMSLTSSFVAAGSDPTSRAAPGDHHGPSAQLACPVPCPEGELCEGKGTAFPNRDQNSYDRDGRTDVAVFKPGGKFSILRSSNNVGYVVTWGTQPGEYLWRTSLSHFGCR
jgi:hypothetical protein